MTPVAREHLDKCYARLNTKADPFRIVWTEARFEDRKFFCRMCSFDMLFAKLPWDAIPADKREHIAKRVADLRHYLNDKAGALDAVNHA